jgi:hypothetical protein
VIEFETLESVVCESWVTPLVSESESVIVSGFPEASA